jgi:UDP-2-acetamido-2,6-beta-L-arabino-hexul-4-ose reductase
LIFSSSVQAAKDTPYGQSKLMAEQLLSELATKIGNSVVIFRLVGVFGKFCKPDYNSVVATYCHNISRGLPITISDPSHILRLAYIDDVIDAMLESLESSKPRLSWGEVGQIYRITLQELADQIAEFERSRSTLVTSRVGEGLTRALYSTYVSHLPAEQFTYDLKSHSDERGIFVEMLKTRDAGQYSFFTVLPGVTRGSHYQHTKTEKFLVVKGSVRVRCRHLITGELFTITLSADRPQVLDTIPGWVHDITNLCDDDAIIMLWANEIFDIDRPDTVACEV